jgi:adenylate kinase family enzyme
MKIYFSGAHGSGKSTVARYVSQKYKLPMISECARAILSELELQIDTLRYDLDVVDQYQGQVFERQLLEESKYKNFVSDRSIIDCLSYSAQHSRILPDLLARIELSDYIKKLQDKNSILFFVRPSKDTLCADGVRETISWDGVISIDSQIKFMLEMWKIPYFQINMTNMQERTRIIDNILELIL